MYCEVFQGHDPSKADESDGGEVPWMADLQNDDGVTLLGGAMQCLFCASQGAVLIKHKARMYCLGASKVRWQTKRTKPLLRCICPYTLLFWHVS